MGEITNVSAVFSEPYPGLQEKPRCSAATITDYLKCLTWPNDPSKIRITWPNSADNITGSTIYAHYIRIDRFSGIVIDSRHTSKQITSRCSDNNHKSVEIDGLYPNYHYKIRISDTESVPNTQWTDSNSITIKPGHIHPPYYTKAYAISETSIRLYWQGFADSYTVRYRKITDPISNWRLVSNIKELQYTFVGLDKDSEYEFQVRGHNNAGFISYWGPAPCDNDIHLPSIPDNTHDTNIQNQITKYLRIRDNDNSATYNYNTMLTAIKDSYPDPLKVTLNFTPSKPIINIADSDIYATNIKFTITFPSGDKYPWGGAIDQRAKRFKITYTNTTDNTAAKTKTVKESTNYLLENLMPGKTYAIKCQANNGENTSAESDVISKTTKNAQLIFRSADSAIIIKIDNNKIGWLPSQFSTKELQGTTDNPKFPSSWTRNGGRRSGIYYDTHNKRLVFDPTYAGKYPNADYILRFYTKAEGSDRQRIGTEDLKFIEGHGDWEKFWEINWNPFLLDINRPYDEINNKMRETLIVELYEGN